MKGIVKTLICLLGMVQFVVFLSANPLPYTGKLSVNGVNFHGRAEFSFAIRDANGDPRIPLCLLFVRPELGVGAADIGTKRVAIALVYSRHDQWGVLRAVVDRVAPRQHAALRAARVGLRLRRGGRRRGWRGCGRRWTSPRGS